MNMKSASQMTACGIALTGAVFFASVVESAHLRPALSSGSWQIAATVPTPAPEVPNREQEKKQESAHPPVKAAPAESRTPEEAAARAADPKDPSGALIVEPPLGAGSPAKPR
jgi:hypothetical protein